MTVVVVAAVSMSLPLMMHTKLHYGISVCRVSSFRCSGGGVVSVGTKRKAMDAAVE